MIRTRGLFLALGTSMLVSANLTLAQNVITAGNCSPIVSQTSGNVSINCATFSAAQLAQINSLVRESAATREAVAKIIALLENPTGSASTRIAQAERYAQEIKRLTLEIAKLKDDLSAAKAREAIRSGDVRVASQWISVASRMKVDKVVPTRRGDLVFGNQGSTFEPVLAFAGKFVHIPYDSGTTFRFNEEFGVKRIWEHDILLAAASGGGTACPSYYALLVVTLAEERQIFKFGNCNETISWKAPSSEAIDITVPRSGPTPHDVAQKLSVRLVQGNIQVSLNGKALRPHYQ